MIRLLKFNIVLLGSLVLFACKQNSHPKVITELPKQESDSVMEKAVEEKTKKVSETEIIFTEEWKEIIERDSTIKLDIRYATENNFTKKQIYDCPRCLLKPHVHDQLMKFQAALFEQHQLGIILYDCYRPRPYQQRLWDIVPDERFVGNPAKGSMHNRGMAVDIGLIDMQGNILDMGSDFDHFGEESFHSATNISDEAKKNRKILKEGIEAFGFEPITSEWWHYSYRKDIKALTEWVWPCPES